MRIPPERLLGIGLEEYVAGVLAMRVVTCPSPIRILLEILSDQGVVGYAEENPALLEEPSLLHNVIV